MMPDHCPGCGATITDRYLPYGVCQDCYGTADDPWEKERGNGKA